MRYILFLFSIFLIPASPLTLAADGDPDLSWGTTGAVVTAFPNATHDEARAMAIQNDGKIVVAGFSGADFAVVRYNPNGTLDTTFNETGRVTTNFGSADQAYAVALQPDGKIVIGGKTGDTSDTRIALVRYLPNGALDTSFNSTGIQILDLSLHRDEIRGLAIQDDGKIVAGAMVFDSFAALRFNPDGSLDLSFNDNGRSLVPMGGSVSGMALQADGKIIVAGSAPPSFSFNAFAMVRFNANGSVDTTFNGNGKVYTAVTESSNTGRAVLVQGDGKILMAGITRQSNDDFAIVRYLPDGSLDTSFNGTGKVITQVGLGSDSASAIAVQANGKIVVAGRSFNNAGQFNFAVLRYLPNGSLDTSFASAGKLITDLVGSDQLADMKLQSDGRIVLAGYYYNGSNDDMIVARYLVDGITLPPTLTSPANGTIVHNPIAVSYNLPEAAKAGSLTLTFIAGGSSRVLTLPSSLATIGSHNLAFDPANPAATSGVVGDSIPDGTYDAVLSYRDTADNPPATATATNVQVVRNNPPTSRQAKLRLLTELTKSIAVEILLPFNTDYESDSLTITALSPTSALGGVVSLVNGTITYTAPTGATGYDTIYYTVDDSKGGTSVGSVRITIGPTDGSSLKAIGIGRTAGGVLVQFTGSPGISHLIQFRDSLISPWQFVGPSGAIDAGEDGHFDFEDNETPLPTSRFYRALEP